MSDDNFLITKVKSYSPQYTDKGSGAAEDVSFFARSSEQPVFGQYILSDYFGQRPVKNYPPSADVTTVEFLSGDATRKVGGGASWWKQLWNDKGSGKPDDFTCWTIREEHIPAGYVCLSPCFFKVQKNGQGQLRDPPTDAEVVRMVLVRADFVSYIPASSLSRVWTDRDTHADQYLAIYTGPDGVGCFGCNNPNWVPPSGKFPILNRSKGRLVWEWPQLSQAVKKFTGVTLIPNPTSVGDPRIMSNSKERLQKVWSANQANFRAYRPATYDCEDFAFEMRAAAARARADSDICVRAKSGGFCGVVYVTLREGRGSHAMNLVLLPDETLELFEPQTGQFTSKDSTIESVQHAIY